MVFNLIRAGIFGKTDEDSMDDFKAVYDFRGRVCETVSARACRYRQEIVSRSARPKGQLSRHCCEGGVFFHA